MQRVQKLILLFFFLTISNMVFAQTDSTVVEVENFVTVYKDPRLDILDTRPAIMIKLELEGKANVAKKEKEIPLYKPIVSADGKKKVTGSIYTTKGFKIVIFNGTDRTQAMLAKNKFARAYPGISSAMSYNVPSYKIKVGDFENRNDASKFLRKISGAFPTAFIVPDIITVKNINVSN